MGKRGKPEHSLMDGSSTFQVEGELLLPDCSAELGASLKALFLAAGSGPAPVSGDIQSGAQMS